MQKEQYFNKISTIIEDIEVNHKVRETIDNYEQLKSYWEIGKLLVDAQGGESRAKYGRGLIKEWSALLTKKYGSNYSERKLEMFRKFFLTFENPNALRSNLTWTHS